MIIFYVERRGATSSREGGQKSLKNVQKSTAKWRMDPQVKKFMVGQNLMNRNKKKAPTPSGKWKMPQYVGGALSRGPLDAAGIEAAMQIGGNVAWILKKSRGAAAAVIWRRHAGPTSPIGMINGRARMY